MFRQPPLWIIESKHHFYSQNNPPCFSSAPLPTCKCLVILTPWLRHSKNEKQKKIRSIEIFNTFISYSYESQLLFANPSWLRILAEMKTCLKIVWLLLKSKNIRCMFKVQKKLLNKPSSGHQAIPDSLCSCNISSIRQYMHFPNTWNP